MKTIIFKIFITAFLTLCVVNISVAGDCENAEEMLGKAVSIKPDFKTEDNIRSAIAKCPDNPSLYDRAGDYFSPHDRRNADVHSNLLSLVS